MCKRHHEPSSLQVPSSLAPKSPILSWPPWSKSLRVFAHVHARGKDTDKTCMFNYICVHVHEDGKGGNVTMMISPTLSCGSSFVKTIWKQLNSLFANRLTGHMDLLAHRTGVQNSSPVHHVCGKVFYWPDGLVSE
jgi:hypothetical protein